MNTLQSRASSTKNPLPSRLSLGIYRPATHGAVQKAFSEKALETRMEPIAYLTVEVKHRELESRLVIANYLLQAGFAVVIGQQWSIFTNAAALPPGVILFKTVNDIQARNMATFKAHGHAVAATDEEVLLCMEDSCFMLAFGSLAADNCDLFLAQNEAHQTAIERRFPQLTGKVSTVGNPRIDLLSPAGRTSFQGEADELRRQHGPYVLFNTNYGSLNSIWGSLTAVAQIAANAGAFNPKDPNSVEEFRGLIEWERRNQMELTPLMHWAAANLKGHKIVIRPHPGERREFWDQEFPDKNRVLVVPRSNPHPWILGADLVVHTGCTTGLEAVLLDKAVVNVMPSDHPVFDRIVNWANPTFKTWQEAAIAIESLMVTGAGPITDDRTRYEATLNKFFPGYREGNAARSIAKQLIALLRSKGAEPAAGYTWQPRPPGFQPFARSDTLKDKISATQDEFVAGLKNARRLTGVARDVKVGMLDDSLLLALPR